MLIENSLHLVLQLNFYLKTAHRILLRLGHFKAKEFPALEHSLRKLKPKLRQHLTEDQGISYEVACAKSRLNNEKRVKEVLENAWGAAEETSSQKVYLRFYDDLCTLSLDCSGEHLHRRGYRKFLSQAPLRETLAAYMVRELIQGCTFSELSEVHLMDPMAGSGTLLFEAENIYSGEWARTFAFQQWRSCPPILQTENYRKNHRLLSPTRWASLTAFDVDASMGKVISENGPHLKFIHQDLFKAEIIRQSPVWIISNLPYGERVPVSFSLAEYMAQIQRVFKPKRIGLLMSQSQSKEMEKVKHPYSSVRKIPLKNGGISVVLWILA